MKVSMPNFYIQEKGALCKLGDYIKEIASDNIFIIMDEFSYNNFREKIELSISDSKLNAIIESFKGECSMDNINTLVDKAKGSGSKAIIGIGGGKVLDVAKAVGYFADTKAIMIPTAASMDGPASKISVLYENDGTFKEYLHLKTNPYAVIVDTEIIANAPARLLKAGIGDALSTYFETEAGYEGEVERNGFSTISNTARALSKECYQVVMRDGLKAVQAVENKEVTRELENVVEAIIYLSCVGFENGSLACAHAVANALSSTTKYNSFMHGEKVAFGTIVQLLVQMEEFELVTKVRDFCKSLGLPYSSKQFGIDTDEEIDFIVSEILSKDAPINNMKKYCIDKDNIKSAINFTKNFI